MARRYLHRVIRTLIFCDSSRTEGLLKEIGITQAPSSGGSGKVLKLHRKVDGRDLRFHISFSHSVEETRKRLRSEYFNVLVVDDADADRDEVEKTRTFRLHKAVREEIDIQGHIPWRWERTLVLLPQAPCSHPLAFALGRLRLGGYDLRPTDASQFFGAITAVAERRSEVGKTAICLAGGGIEGLIYEMGVLRALDFALEGKSVLDFDIYCGISAGAILASVLANGVPPEQFIRAFEQDSTAIAPIGQSVIFDFDIREYLARVGHLLSGVGRLKKGLAGLMALSLRSVPVGFFAGDRIEEHTRRELQREGRSDDFRQLKKELYIGATDQDTSEHIVFGDKGWDDVPIPEAVRASMALVPFYSPKWIRGRWFVDGSYTRTTETEVALEKGAKMVIIVDPLIPIRSTVSGYVKAKGGVFGAIQGLKALVHTRFTEGFGHALESHPDVDFYVFKPEQDDMRLMSGSPLKYHYRMEIQRIAFRRTLERIFEDQTKMENEWQRHGFRFNLDRVQTQLNRDDLELLEDPPF